MADQSLLTEVAEYALNEARLGNPWPLITLLGDSHPLGPELQAFLATPEMRAFLVELLKTKHGRRGQVKLCLEEKTSIGARVESLEAGERGKPPMKREAAVRTVMDEHKCSRRTVFAALQVRAIYTKRNGDQIPLRKEDLKSAAALQKRVLGWAKAVRSS